jgi:hypothetical protein
MCVSTERTIFHTTPWKNLERQVYFTLIQVTCLPHAANMKIPPVYFLLPRSSISYSWVNWNKIVFLVFQTGCVKLNLNRFLLRSTSHLYSWLLSCIWQSGQPKSLNWQEKGANSILQPPPPPHLHAAPSCRIRGYWSGLQLFYLIAPAKIRTRDL